MRGARYDSVDSQKAPVEDGEMGKHVREEENIFAILESQNIQRLKAYIERCPRGMEAENEDGVWALHTAMAQGNPELARYVAEYVIVTLDRLDGEGNSALHYGVRSGSLELVKYLTERVGYSAVKANFLGETPYDTALKCGFPEIAGYFETVIGSSVEEMYHNPICRGMHPDPSIVRVGEDYYMVNSSFMYFPCIPISHSKDLIHWEVIGHAITNPEWAALRGLEGGRGYWAPDISYYEGKFYIAATYRLNEGGKVQRLQMVTSAERAEGPYCRPVFLEEDGIDPSIFTDGDGKRYMLLNRGARIFEISADGRRILSEPRLLWYGDCKRSSEGPHILQKDGWYYLFLAEGGTGRGHRVSVARSRTLMGVYEPCPYNPILRQWDERGQLQCCGHGMPVDTPDGDWYMVYLCTRFGTSGYGLMGRETALEPMTWTADGWPLVNSLRGPSDLQKKPRLRQYKAETADFAPERDFWGEWFTVRGTQKGRFERKNGKIIIHGNGTDLNTLEDAPVLLQAQHEFVFDLSCTVSVEQEVSEDWDCGLTCYYDENSFLKLAYARRSGKTGVLAAEYVDSGYRTELFLPMDLKTGKVQLRIATCHLTRSCFYREGDEKWRQITVFEHTEYLCSEGLKKGKRFTGAAAGIYVHGRLDGCFS